MYVLHTIQFRYVVYIPYPHKIYPRSLLFLHLFNCRYFFEVLRYYFDVVRFIFERGLWSGEGKSYADTVFDFFKQVGK